MSEALLDHATQTMAVGSKSFATAAKLFDPATRRSALMLYAWCRHCDDVIDGQMLGFAADVPGDDTPEPWRGDTPATRLERLRESTRLAYADEPMTEPAFAAFQEVARTHEIPPSQAFDHLEGYAMDVREETYPHLPDTLRYCYHVAGVVGLMMARVMGVRDEAVLDRACDLGLAFQLTNIARDILDDARLGRCYLPLAWLAEFEVPLDELAEARHRPALAAMAKRLVAVAEPYYDSAREGLPALPLRSAWAIATARGVYRRIGVKVSRVGEDALEQRQGTSKAEKIGLLMQGAGVALSARGRRPGRRRDDLWQRPR
ncbi:15-cis-phytoene synthase CrtB [Salinicola halophilus]|uniref:15-cis-phytoene synthase CrtB n=1 Tax=Salinicola halophilus TaxID=184065 RepID=UPI000DA17399|nr:15-cis-phytoene synthase CrtB [Salinicola halophilus]